jgi:hypothetical protein
MHKSHHPSWLLLRIWASKLERGLLTQNEISDITNFFRRIAQGESTDEILGIERQSNRPNNASTEHYVWQVHGLTECCWNGTPGLKIGEAIAKVAASCHVHSDTVKKAYYSREGKSILAQIKAALQNPLE